MENKIDVSVVMGVYNAAAVLPATMENILSQEGVAFEFVIVNDGSEDASGQILQEYAGKDSRIRIIHQDNQGLTKALIKGCASARGKYIARQDAGDFSLPGRLSAQKEALDADGELVLISCWTEYCGPYRELLFTQKGTGESKQPIPVAADSSLGGMIDWPTSHGSVMFRKEAYLKAGGYREEFYFAQDWDLWYRLVGIGRFKMIERPYYQLLLTPGSISANNLKKQRILGELAKEAFHVRRRGLSEQELLEKSRGIRPDGKSQGSRAKDAAWFYFIGECLRRNGDDRALSYLVKAIAMSPLSVKAWIRMLQCVPSLFFRRFIRV